MAGLIVNNFPSEMKTCPLHIKKERAAPLFVHYHNYSLFWKYQLSSTLSWQRILCLDEWQWWVLPLEMLLILLCDLSREQDHKGCWQTCPADFPAAQTNLWQLYFSSPHSEWFSTPQKKWQNWQYLCYHHSFIKLCTQSLWTVISWQMKTVLFIFLPPQLLLLPDGWKGEKTSSE